MLRELDEECFEEHFGELFPHAHAGAAAKWDVVKARGVFGSLGHKPLRLEVLLVGESVCNVMGVTDAVDDVPALGNLVAL